MTTRVHLFSHLRHSSRRSLNPLTTRRGRLPSTQRAFPSPAPALPTPCRFDHSGHTPTHEQFLSAPSPSSACPRRAGAHARSPWCRGTDARQAVRSRCDVTQSGAALWRLLTSCEPISDPLPRVLCPLLASGCKISGASEIPATSPFDHSP